MKEGQFFVLMLLFVGWTSVTKEVRTKSWKFGDISWYIRLRNMLGLSCAKLSTAEASYHSLFCCLESTGKGLHLGNGTQHRRSYDIALQFIQPHLMAPKLRLYLSIHFGNNTRFCHLFDIILAFWFFQPDTCYITGYLLCITWYLLLDIYFLILVTWYL